MTNEKLQCSANNKRSDVDIVVGYETFAQAIEGFQELSCTSDSILVPETLLKLASDSSLTAIFKEHQAKCHTTVYIAYIIVHCNEHSRDNPMRRMICIPTQSQDTVVTHRS